MLISFVGFLKDVILERKLILRLAVNDFKSKYAGSFFGIAWAFAQPLITILVFWFVFEMGFKSAPVNDIPFILWFIPAYVPWIFFSDILMAASTCLYEYNYLVKKVKFRVSVLPMMKILSAFFVHIFFIAFIFLMFGIYGYPVSPIYFQAFYYTFALVVFSLGLSWAVSALSVFFKDMSQLISIIIQIGFWATPIFWNPDKMDPKVAYILKLNPIYYIIRGYRDSFVYKVPFWDRMGTSIYFWCVTAVLFVLGAIIFKKLRPHFADEL